jgi:hypothetical protein
MPENHKSLSFIFLKEKNSRFGCKWPDWTQKKGTVLSMNKVKCMQRDHVTVQVG